MRTRMFDRKQQYALSWIDTDSDVAVTPLIESLTDPDDDVRWWVAVALGRIGPNAAPAVPGTSEFNRNGQIRVSDGFGGDGADCARFKRSRGQVNRNSGRSRF